MKANNTIRLSEKQFKKMLSNMITESVERILLDEGFFGEIGKGYFSGGYSPWKHLTTIWDKAKAKAGVYSDDYHGGRQNQVNGFANNASKTQYTQAMNSLSPQQREMIKNNEGSLQVVNGNWQFVKFQ